MGKSGIMTAWRAGVCVACALCWGAASPVWAQAPADDGLRVWNADVLAPELDLIYGGRGEALGPLTIVGTRNGSFSGKVVVGSTQPIKGLKATVGDLLGPGGAKIAPASVHVRYPRASGEGSWNSIGKAVAQFDALADAPPAEIPVMTTHRDRRMPWVVLNYAYQPIWVTVNVPADAQPGEYAGQLAITAKGGKPLAVPVRLHVDDFRLPDPSNYTTCVDFVESPESVAMRYHVPLWSDRHFELIGKSLDLLSGVGNRSINLYLVCQTNHGNAQSMVRWISHGGGWRPDFSVLDRYLDVVEKHMGKPKRVFLYVWDYQYNERTEPEGFKGCVEASTGEVLVSTVDAEGKVGIAKLPKYGTPASKALWKPVIEGVMARLKKQGLEKSALLGWASDGPPTKDIVRMFAELAPGVPWAVGSHSFYGHQDRAIAEGGSPVRYATLVSASRDSRRHHDVAQFFAWKEGDLVTTAYYRGMRNNSPITDFRFMADRPTEGGVRGVGRIGADFWPVLKDKRGKVVGTLSARYPQSGWRNLDVRMTLLAPGPDGAISTTRFEMFREGVQECEARLFIEKALLDGKLPAPLAARCREVLTARKRVLDNLHKTERRGVTWQQKDEIYEHFLQANWQALTNRLYAAAADVANAVKAKQTGGKR